MKKLLFVLAALAAIMFVGCASPAGSSDVPAETSTTNSGNGNGNSGSSTTYTLSFNENYPFDDSWGNDNEGNWNPLSLYTDTTSGRKYYFSADNNTQNSVDGSTVTLEESPFSYGKYVVLGFDNNNSVRSSRQVKSYIFDHYNTKADDTGTSYNSGSSINLSSDTVLYVFYKEKIEDWVDFSEKTTLTMKVGETIRYKPFLSDDITDIEIRDISPDNLITYTGWNVDSLDSAYTITAKAVGTVSFKLIRVDADGNEIDNTYSPYRYCEITITSDDFEDFGGNTVEYKMIGTWILSGDNYSGTIELNADKTGHIISYLNNTITHDSDFNWTAKHNDSYADSSELLLYFGNVSRSADVDVIGGNHGIKISSDYTVFTLDEYLCFGMPKRTTWHKQE